MFKQKFILWFSIAICASCSDSKSPNSPVPFMEYPKGNVKVISEFLKTNEFGDYTELNKSKAEFVKSLSFSSEGLLVQKKELSNYTLTYTYNDKKQLVIVEHTDPDNAIGLLLEESLKSESNDSMEFYSKDVIKYKKNGQILDLRGYENKSERLEEIKKYSYSANGKEVKVNEYTVQEGEPIYDGYTIFKYDTNNYLVEEEYLHTGNLYNKSGYIAKYHFSNDGNGNPIEIKSVVYDKNGKSPSEPDFKYFQYEYDDQGNWIKYIQTMSISELHLEQYERKIEYY